jgi:hypothetical protein
MDSLTSKEQQAVLHDTGWASTASPLERVRQKLARIFAASYKLAPRSGFLTLNRIAGVAMVAGLILVPGSAGDGVVTSIKACEVLDGRVARADEEDQLQRVSLPARDQQAIWLYLRFTLSLRDVEDLLAERGVAVSYETVRRWVSHFGPMIAADLRKRRLKPHTTCTSTRSI